jgi:membrane-bound lytic murein transglycosylase D
VRSLAKWNSMAPGDPLRLGQKLVIWDRSADRRTVRSIHYQVRSGDSLARISSRFKVSVNDLCNWNGITPKNYLQPGQTLKLYVDVTRQAES